MTLKPVLSACTLCGRVLLSGCASVQNCWTATRLLRLRKGIGLEAALHARYQRQPLIDLAQRESGWASSVAIAKGLRPRSPISAKALPELR
ncbi:hypothetical protein [Synechococcus sp. CC9311]|uniref:hypothetical protein n=1 Tax=Synechococcus sp. (strain CC9311) TaxID=64471 RepID=UPI00143B546F|nr:hypothetical protein [Synechococcus sp. CC9311]